MKTLLLLLCSAVSFGQITTSGAEVEAPITLSNGKRLGLEITYTEGNPNTYVMTFRNRMYHNLIDFRTIAFTATEDELYALYEDFDRTFDEQKEKQYTLNNATVRVIPKGKDVYFFVYHPGKTDSFFFINRDRLARAFGL